MTILVAIDENERSREVVRVGHDLATAYDDTMIALHVAPEEDYEEHRRSLREIPGFQEFSFSQEASSAKRFAREFVKSTLGKFDEDRVEARGRVGPIAEEILAAADSLEPRYLVISGRRRSPVGKAIFGNTTQNILLNADIPVVTVMEQQ